MTSGSSMTSTSAELQACVGSSQLMGETSFCRGSGTSAEEQDWAETGGEGSGRDCEMKMVPGGSMQMVGRVQCRVG